MKFDISTLKGKPIISDAVIAAIRDDLDLGITQREIAKRHGVSQAFVSMVSRNVHRKRSDECHVT